MHYLVLKKVKERKTQFFNFLVMNIYNSIDRFEYLAAVCLDLPDAFDMAYQDILLEQLHFLGFRGIGHIWLKSLLSNRVEYVSIG